MSRPPTEPGGLTKVLYVRISERLDARLGELADRDPEGRSKAAIVREMVETLVANIPSCDRPACRSNSGQVNHSFCASCQRIGHQC